MGLQVLSQYVLLLSSVFALTTFGAGGVVGAISIRSTSNSRTRGAAVASVPLVSGSTSSGAAYHEHVFQNQQEQLYRNNLGPASMQYMAMNHDGQYSFAYTGGDSARQERRNPDGSVYGKYSYTNPDGKLVHVEYTADALNGFNAISDSLPNNIRQRQLSSNNVVQDTPAVHEARKRFFETYARELARINTAATGTSNAAGGNVDVGVSGVQKGNSGSNAYSVAGFDSNNLPESAYYQNLAVPLPNYNSGPAYFYYVGVGGNPYYVTSPVRNTNIAVSVRAHELGAIPADAVHDAQVPRYGNNANTVRNTQPTPPVYVETGKDYTIPNGNSQKQPVVSFHQTQTTSTATGNGDSRTITSSTSSTSSLPTSAGQNSSKVQGVSVGVDQQQHQQNQFAPNLPSGTYSSSQVLTTAAAGKGSEATAQGTSVGFQQQQNQFVPVPAFQSGSSSSASANSQANSQQQQFPFNPVQFQPGNNGYYQVPYFTIPYYGFNPSTSYSYTY